MIYKILLNKGTNVKDTSFKAHYEKQKVLLAQWVESQKAFKEMAKQLLANKD